MSEAIRFDDRVAIVTGAGGGLGRSHAQMLAERGARVIVNDIAKAEKAAAEMRAEGFEAMASAADVSTPDGAASLVEAAIEAYGRIDVLINNAAVGRFTPISETTVEEYELVRGAGLDSTFYVTREAWPWMARNGYGRVVMTTSITGLIGGTGAAAYAIAKTGCYGLMRACAIDGAEEGIKANALAPGAYTPMLVERAEPAHQEMMRREYPPELVSPIVILLASEQCPVSGRVFEALGGRVGTLYVASTTGVFDIEQTPESLLADWEQLVDQSEPHFFEHAREAMKAEREAALRSANQ